MATNNQLNVGLSGSTGTGSFVGSVSPTLTGTPLIGASPYSIGIVTPWVAYVPTFTGFGTPASNAVWSRRVGGSLEVRGVVVTGTTTAVEARMTLGFNGTDSNVTASNTVLSTLGLSGPMYTTTNGADTYTVLMEQNIGYFTFGYRSVASTGLTKGTGSGLWLAATTLYFYASVPIDTWP